MDVEKDLVSESWRTKDYDKVLLSRKLTDATRIIGLAMSSPTMENIKLAYGAANDYVSYIPTIERLVNKRDKLLEDLDVVGLVIDGDRKEAEVQKAMAKLKIGTTKTRIGITYVDTLTNLPYLVREIRRILVAAGDLAVMWGLRVSVTDKKSKGMDKTDEEEGIEEKELEELGLDD